ncbi:MAG: hypothetical protein COT85_07025 [Chlamydiae bacterium CG10_big_fil_rev_8_21_14_0_10_42_34]|nr:MAG: hypothetical protein COT85_07025 [Chlamydiae bacterium CG10_big_fil_rev_8_21_14_0_10_42_34]
MIKETKSNWECVTSIIKQETPVTLSELTTQLFLDQPEELLSFLNQYKFASKLLKKDQKVLDIGCREGLGSYILAKEGVEVHGVIEMNTEYKMALANFSHPNLTFSCQKVSQIPSSNWDAIICLNHPDSLKTQTEIFLKDLYAKLDNSGLVILSLPADLSLFEKVSKFLQDKFMFFWKFAIYNDTIIPDNKTLIPLLPSLIIGGKKRK